jgi:Putative prokaryotic signal transducing protein
MMLSHGASQPATRGLTQERGRERAGMVEIIRTNDLVVIGFVQSLLEHEDIPVLVADGHISVLEGSIGAFPRRMLVPEAYAAQARRLITEAGLAAELRHA